MCSPSQNPTASLFFLPPITSELSKRAFADTNRSQTDLVRTFGEQEAHSEASELLNGLSFFSSCLSDMQIHAARCSKNPKLQRKYGVPLQIIIAGITCLQTRGGGGASSDITPDSDPCVCVCVSLPVFFFFSSFTSLETSQFFCLGESDVFMSLYDRRGGCRFGSFAAQQVTQHRQTEVGNRKTLSNSERRQRREGMRCDTWWTERKKRKECGGGDSRRASG